MTQKKHPVQNVSEDVDAPSRFGKAPAHKNPTENTRRAFWPRTQGMFWRAMGIALTYRKYKRALPLGSDVSIPESLSVIGISKKTIDLCCDLCEVYIDSGVPGFPKFDFDYLCSIESRVLTGLLVELKDFVLVGKLDAHPRFILSRDSIKVRLRASPTEISYLDLAELHNYIFSKEQLVG